jgi:metallophosphoesterase (TIGR00282 family)
MKILCIGDVTSPPGVRHLESELWRVRREWGVDFCVVNAENASLVSTLSREQAEVLLAAGADVLTGGNHTMRSRAIHSLLDSDERLLRPVNFPEDVPGAGYGIYDAKGYRVLVINAMGTVHIDPVLDSPYPYIDRILRREEGKYDFAVLDFHAEATGEKVAMGYAYDGKIQMIFGTHTHVPTADECILPLGTGYVTDVGMCGESGGVLGMNPEGVVRRMRTRLSIPFTPAGGKVVADGVLFTYDTTKGRTTEVRRIRF